MKNVNKLLIATLLVIGMSACQKKYDEFAVNPNQATVVPPGLLLVKQLNDISGGLGGVEPWGGVARYNQYFCRNYQYYGDNTYSFTGGPFNVYNENLKNIDRMETEATNAGGATINPYSAIAKFIKAYYYYNLSSLMGDVPMTEAVKGLGGVFNPVYDEQKTVFLQVIKWLDEANDDFASLASGTSGSAISSFDIFYQGDMTRWRKMVNVFKLRVLMSLSKKAADTDLKIATRINEMMTNTTKYPLFASSADNLKYVYNNDVNRYPTTPVDYGFDALRLNMAETYVKSCTDIKDPRVLLTCEPAWKIVDDNGYVPTDFRAFIGSPTGQDQNIMEANALTGKLSMINRYRYYRTNTGEDFIIVGYTEMCFNIAEAINRGYTSGNAENWYKAGIQNSLDFYGIINGTNSVNYLRPGQSLGSWTNTSFNFDFNTYYAQPAVAYETGAAGLSKILLQKYIGFFQNSGWEAYYNFRRTGVPAFSAGVGVGNGGILPVRWSYPGAEQNVNGVNWKAAVDRQYSGNDNLNGQMWILKP